MKLNLKELKSELIRIAEYNDETYYFKAKGDITLNGKPAYVDAYWRSYDMMDLQFDDILSNDDELDAAIDNAMELADDGFWYINGKAVAEA